jgi:hypothetical protein
VRNSNNASHGAGSQPSVDQPSVEVHALTLRFYSIKHRCGRARYYERVTFGFESAHTAAEYMLATCGPLLPGMTVDRVNGRRGYAPGNLRYATPTEQLANRRFKSRDHATSIKLATDLGLVTAPERDQPCL